MDLGAYVNIENFDQIAKDNGIPILRIPYIYDANKDKNKIEKIIKEFLKTKLVPNEIIEFYEAFEFSNYPQIAKQFNKKINKQRFVA